MEITDKLAMVTGGSRGIGRAIAIALAQAGAGVIVNYKEHRAAGEYDVEQIRWEQELFRSRTS